MAKMKINNLDQLEDLVLNPKISKIDKYLIFKNVLKSFPIIFIDVVTDDSEAMNGIEDENNTLISKMQKIIREIRDDPTASSYSGMSVIRNGAKNEPEANINIDFTE
jgi:hypothetical protein